MKKTARIILIALCVLLGLFILSINGNLASFANSFYPGVSPYVHIGLIVIEIIGILWFWNGLFGWRQHLHFPEEPTEKNRKDFTRELVYRMGQNSLLKKEKFDPKDEKYLENCLEYLDGKADKEIKVAAERVFLATALSQNGRIDALIVFLSLCRLVWRISGIYNQRPRPSEILALYWAVVSSTFLALTFEELDISTEITVGFGEVFNSMTPSIMTSGMPFVGPALQKFTSSSIDGAANAYLALRAGIITRNAYGYSISGKERPSRASVYREAGGVLLGMANGLVDQVARALGQGLWKITKEAPKKTTQAVVDGVSKVGKGVSSSASKVFGGAAGSILTAGSSMKDPNIDFSDLEFVEPENSAAAHFLPDHEKFFQDLSEDKNESSLKSSLKDSSAMLKEGVKEINDFVDKAVIRPSVEMGQVATEGSKAAGSLVGKVVRKSTGFLTRPFRSKKKSKDSKEDKR